MNEQWAQVVQWWRGVRARHGAPELTLLTATIMTVGVFLLTRSAVVVSTLLVAPTGLVAWTRGWIGGVVAALVAAALTAPYPGNSSLVSPPLDVRVWGFLVLGYVILGVMIGFQGVESRREAAQRQIPVDTPEPPSARGADVLYKEIVNEMNAGREQLQRMNKELALLNSIATAVNSSLEIAQVQSTALANIGSLLELDVVQLYSLSDDGELFVLQTSRPRTVEEVIRPSALRLPANEGLLGRVKASQRVELIADDHDTQSRPSLIGADVRHLMAVPLRLRSRLVGVLLLGRKRGKPFTPDDGHFMESVGRALAVAIENARMFKQAQEMSLSDELTGLPNRRMFNLRLSMEFDRVTSSGAPLCLVTFDLDFFKRVNDRYGHQAGDEVLQEFARRVQHDIRSTDLFCRTGGEEFSLVVPDAPVPVAASVACRIAEHIASEPFEVEGGLRIPMTVSGGVASTGPGIGSAEDMVAAADQALYAAKSSGRNCVRVYGSAGVMPETPPA